MRRRGPKFIDHEWSGQHGAVSLAELLIVMAISSTLIISLFRGQEFVTRLSQRFFATAILESESRLLLERIQLDLTQTTELGRLVHDHWILVDWHGDTVVYQLEDSNLVRSGEPLVRERVRLSRFELTADTVIVDEEKHWWPHEFEQSRPTVATVRVVISFAMSHQGKTLEIDALYAIQKRAPGT